MATIITGIIISALWVAWGFCVQYIGYSEFSKMLGGSKGFMVLLALLLVPNFKHKTLSKLVLCAVSMIFGLLIANYLFSYSLHNSKHVNFPTSLWLVMIPFVILWSSYAFTVDYFLLTECEKKEETEALRSLRGFIGGVLSIPFGLAFIIIAICHAEELRNINSLDQQIVLGASIIGGLLFLTEIRKIPLETLNYFSRSIPRFTGDIINTRKWFAIGTLVFLVYSSIFEFVYRRQWIIWAETAICFVIYVAVVYSLGKVLFTPSAISSSKPIIIYLPSWKSKKMLIIAFVSLVLGLLFIFVGIMGWLR